MGGKGREKGERMKGEGKGGEGKRGEGSDCLCSKKLWLRLVNK